MNDETRKALEGIIQHYASDLSRYRNSEGEGGPWYELYEAVNDIEALLADRAATVAEPDAETAERVAKVLAAHESSKWHWDNDSKYRDQCLTKARAAIAAMPSCADAEWLDDALDSLSPGAVVYRTMRIRECGWEAVVAVPEGPDEDGWFNYTNTAVSGTGTTRKAAILDAVKKAKGAERC